MNAVLFYMSVVYVCMCLCVLLTGAHNVPVFVTAVKRVARHHGTVTIELSADSWTFCTWFCYYCSLCLTLTMYQVGQKKLDHF